MEFLFCHILTPSGTFGVFIVTPKAFDHASVFDALGVRMGWIFSRILFYYHVVTVSVKSVFNGSGEPRILVCVQCVKNPQERNLQLIWH